MIEKLVSYVNSLQSFIIKIGYVIENIYFQEGGVGITINSLNNRNSGVYFLFFREIEEEVEIYNTTPYVFSPGKKLCEYLEEKEPNVIIQKVDFVDETFANTVLGLIDPGYDNIYNMTRDLVNEIVGICREKLTLEPVIFGTDVFLEEFQIKLNIRVHRYCENFVAIICIPGEDDKKLEINLEEYEPWVRTGLIMDFIFNLFACDLN